MKSDIRIKTERKKLVNWLMIYYSITIKITRLVWICIGEEAHAMNNKKSFFQQILRRAGKSDQDSFSSCNTIVFFPT